MPLAIACVAICGCNSLPVARLAQPDPEPPAVASGTIPSLPGAHEARVAPFLFRSDRPLPEKHPALTTAASLRDRVAKELKIPPARGVILVYIFGEKGSFDQYLRKRYPQLPSRRAFFVAQGRQGGRDEDLMVLTWWSDRLEQDLRHELTHALLHSALPDVPLWLDEGLAEYFELEDFPLVRKERLTQVLADFNKSDRPDMSRLEGLRDIQQMGREEYRESWAWAHWMLKGPPEARAALLTALVDLRSGRKISLVERIEKVLPNARQQMVAHMRQLDESPAP